MPDTIVEIPGVGPVAFPDSMSQDEMNAAAAKLYQQGQQKTSAPAPAAAPSMIQRVAEWLPTAGGVVGGVLGGVGGTAFGVGFGGVPGAVGGAALGGAAGEATRQLVDRAIGATTPATSTQAAAKMGTQAALQGGSELAGAGLAKVAAPVMTRTSQALMQSALKPGWRAAATAVRSGEVPLVVKTLLDEGVNVTPGGVRKLNTLLDATNSDIKDAIASMPGEINPFKVTANLRDTARTFAQQVNPAADLRAVSQAGTEFLENVPRPLSVPTAQALKQGTYRQLEKKYGQLGSADVESQKALARGLKDEIASEAQKQGIDLTAMNAREGRLIGAKEALARRVLTSGNANPAGFAMVATQRPIAFLTALMDRSPLVKSLLARGLYNQAGYAAGVAPQLVRAAVTAVASTPDEEGQ